MPSRMNVESDAGANGKAEKSLGLVGARSETLHEEAVLFARGSKCGHLIVFTNGVS